ncbi:MAG: cache domain-containing protein [Deltaproteobacteria bacterium]|jgi:PAS domain S-box-containing protein|nr:cache domain-containing protein [Deltaproteobacteria bacterium]
MLKEPKHALTKVIPLLLTAVSLVSIILLAVMWINYEYGRAREDSQRLAKEYYEGAETSLSLETNRICDYISAHTSSSQIKFYLTIKNRVQEIWNMLNGLDTDQRLERVDDRVTQDVILSMLDNLEFSDGQSGYFCLDSKGEMLLGWKGQRREGKGELAFDPESLAAATDSVKAIGEGFYRVGHQKKGGNQEGADVEPQAQQAGQSLESGIGESPGEVPITFLKYYEKFDWILGASSYFSDFEKDLRQELLNWVDNVPLPPVDNLLIIDYKGLIFSHGDPSKIGRNIYEEGFDPALRETLDMVITQAREKGKGIVRFNLPDSFTGQLIDCVAYFRGLNNWEWVVVNWVNSSVLDESLEVLQTNLRGNLTQQIKKVTVISLVILVMVAVISLVISSKLGRGVNAFTKFFNDAATSSVQIDPGAQPFADLALLARAANNMIAQRLAAERKVAENEVKFRTVFEVSPQVIAILSSDGYLLEANGQFERYANCALEEAKGRSLAKSLDIPKKTWSGFLDDLKKEKVIKGQELVLGDNRGQPVYLLMFGKLMSFMEQDFILAVCVDITELRLAELEKSELKEKLSRSQRMEAMGLMAASVAHELNNILSGLIGYPELLLRDETLSLGQRAQVNEILEAGHRATEVVSDMMTMAKGVATAKISVNLAELVEKSLASPPVKIALAASARPVEIDFARPKKNMVVKGSPRHLIKVIQHLVVNAIEAMEGLERVPKISISVEPSQLGSDPGFIASFVAGNYARLAISDNGPGIPDSEIGRIFEPFYTKKPGSGRGLGLSVVEMVVKGHGGGIDVKTSPEGTTFNLYFSAVIEASKAKARPAPDHGDYLGNGQKILIVDDVDIQRKLAQKILKTLGYDPYSVASGEEAVEYLKKSDADLVILDMIMDPGINGRETYEAILAIKPNQKAIIASGMAENEEVEKAQALGASYFVTKPYTIKDIAGAVFKALHPDAH